jgi:hypothetical protein
MYLRFMVPLKRLYKSRNFVVSRIKKLHKASKDDVIAYNIDLFSKENSAPDPADQYLTMRKMQKMGALVYQEPPEDEWESLGIKTFYWKVDVERLENVFNIFAKERRPHTQTNIPRSVDVSLLIKQLERTQKHIASITSDALLLEELVNLVEFITSTNRLKETIETRVALDSSVDQKELNELLPLVEKEVRSCTEEIASLLKGKNLSNLLLENIADWNAFRLKGSTSSEGPGPIMEYKALCSIVSSMHKTEPLKEIAQSYIKFWPESELIKSYKISEKAERVQNLREELLTIRTLKSWGQWNELLQVYECLFEKDQILLELEDLGESMRSLDVSWMAGLFRKVIRNNDTLEDITLGQFSRQKYQSYAHRIIRLIITDLSAHESRNGIPEVIFSLEPEKDRSLLINSNYSHAYLKRYAISFKLLVSLWPYRSELRNGSQQNNEHEPLSMDWIAKKFNMNQDTTRQNLGRLEERMRTESPKLPLSLEKDELKRFYIGVTL